MIIFFPVKYIFKVTLGSFTAFLYHLVKLNHSQELTTVSGYLYQSRWTLVLNWEVFRSFAYYNSHSKKGWVNQQVTLISSGNRPSWATGVSRNKWRRDIIVAENNQTLVSSYIVNSWLTLTVTNLTLSGKLLALTTFYRLLASQALLQVYGKSQPRQQPCI